MNFNSYDLNHFTTSRRKNIDLSLRPCRLPVLSPSARRRPAPFRCRVVPSPPLRASPQPLLPPFFHRLPSIPRSSDTMTLGTSAITPNRQLLRVAGVFDGGYCGRRRKPRDRSKLTAVTHFGDVLPRTVLTHSDIVPIVITGYSRRKRITTMTSRDLLTPDVRCAVRIPCASGYDAPACSLASESSFASTATLAEL